MQLSAMNLNLSKASRVPRGTSRSSGACRVQCVARPQQQQQQQPALQAPIQSSSHIEAFLLTSAAAATPFLLDVQVGGVCVHHDCGRRIGVAGVAPPEGLRGETRQPHPEVPYLLAQSSSPFLRGPSTCQEAR